MVWFCGLRLGCFVGFDGRCAVCCLNVVLYCFGCLNLVLAWCFASDCSLLLTDVVWMVLVRV